jgi:hypothetical protein
MHVDVVQDHFYKVSVQSFHLGCNFTCAVEAENLTSFTFVQFNGLNATLRTFELGWGASDCINLSYLLIFLKVRTTVA